MEVNFPPSGLSHSDTCIRNRRFKMHWQHASPIFVAALCLFGSSIAKASSCSITQFGAVGDGVTNNAGAIQNAFNYAAANKCTALIPAGTFAYRGTLTAKGIAITRLSP
jgi:Pectate lyase superfamily protein